jgi:hypothetical protein
MGTWWTANKVLDFYAKDLRFKTSGTYSGLPTEMTVCISEMDQALTMEI